MQYSNYFYDPSLEGKAKWIWKGEMKKKEGRKATGEENKLEGEEEN